MCRIVTFLISLLVPHFAFGLLNSISISGNPQTLVINTAIAGSDPTSVTDTSTTYSWGTLLGTKIIGKINSNMPSGVTLKVKLDSSEGSSQGFVTMTTTNTTLVSSLPILNEGNGLTISYQLSATKNAAPVTNATRTLTLTIQ